MWGRQCILYGGPVCTYKLCNWDQIYIIICVISEGLIRNGGVDICGGVMWYVAYDTGSEFALFDSQWFSIKYILWYSTICQNVALLQSATHVTNIFISLQCSYRVFVSTMKHVIHTHPKLWFLVNRYPPMISVVADFYFCFTYFYNWFQIKCNLLTMHLETTTHYSFSKHHPLLMTDMWWMVMGDGWFSFNVYLFGHI